MTVADAGRVQRCHQFGREVQRGGGGGDGAGFAGEHRLVIEVVLRIGGAAGGDVGRDRRLAGALQQGLDGLVAEEGKGNAAVVVLGLDLGRDLFGEDDGVAEVEATGVAGEGMPGAAPRALVEGDADPGLAPPSFELGGNDAGIVEDQDIAGAQQRRQVADRRVGSRAAGLHEQAGGVARCGGPQRDTVFGQLEVEQVDFHAPGQPGRVSGAWARPSGSASA